MLKSSKVDFPKRKQRMLRQILKIKLSSNQLRWLSTSVKCHNKSKESEDYTHFGFETVKSKDKAEKGKK